MKKVQLFIISIIVGMTLSGILAEVSFGQVAPPYTLRLRTRYDPPITNYEQGSNLLSLFMQMRRDSGSGWVTGAQAELGHTAPGWNNAVLEYQSSARLILGVWGGTVVPFSVSTSGAGSPFVNFEEMASPGFAPTDSQGITFSSTFTDLYRLNYHINDAPSTPTGPQAINFSPLYDGSVGLNQAYENYTSPGRVALSQSSPYTVNVAAAAPPNGSLSQAAVIPFSLEDTQRGNTVRVRWTALPNVIRTGPTDPAGGDMTPPVVYDIYRRPDATVPGDGVETDRIANGIPGRSYVGGTEGPPFSFDPEIGIGTPATATAAFYLDGINSGLPVPGGLGDGSEYYYFIRSKDSTTPNPDAVGRHKSAALVAGPVTPHDYTPPSQPRLPVAPTTFAAPGAGSLTITWQPPSDNADDLAGYVVIRATSAAGPWPAFVNAAGNADGTTPPTGRGNWTFGPNTYFVAYRGTATSFTDTDLANGTQYFYQVYAFDTAETVGGIRQQGNNYSTPLPGNGTPGVAPPEISNLVALSQADGTVRLEWTEPPTNYGGTKIVFTTGDPAAWDALGVTDGSPIATATGATVVAGVAPLGTTTLTHTSLTPGTLYRYKAFAFNNTSNNGDPVVPTRMYSANGIRSAALTAVGGGGGGGVADLAYDLQIVLADAALGTVNLRWRAIGATTFDVYRSTNAANWAVGGAGPALRMLDNIAPGSPLGVPGATLTLVDGLYTLGPIAVPFAAEAAQHFFRVIPGTAALGTSPTEIVGAYRVTATFVATRPRVFTYSLPFTVDTDPGTGAIEPLMATDVIAQVQTQNGVVGADVGFVGFWDPSTGSRAFIDGAAGQTNFEIRQGQAYQVGLNPPFPATISWTIVGKR